MREQWARNIAMVTGVLIVLLAMLFAKIHNPSVPSRDVMGEAVREPPPSAVLPEADPDKQALIASGRNVLEAQSCLGCHSIAAEGNPRFPLDGVSQRRSAGAIRQWILGSDELKDQLPSGAFQIKQAYRHLPPEDINALVSYLQSI